MKPTVFHPEASQEYLQALARYAEANPEVAGRFDAEIRRLVNAISHDPKRFHRFSPPAQRAVSLEFPYSVVYLEEADRVWIVAVMHAKRRPGYWRSRLD